MALIFKDRSLADNKRKIEEIYGLVSEDTTRTFASLEEEAKDFRDFLGLWNLLQQHHERFYKDPSEENFKSLETAINDLQKLLKTISSGQHKIKHFIAGMEYDLNSFDRFARAVWIQSRSIK